MLFLQAANPWTLWDYVWHFDHLVYWVVGRTFLYPEKKICEAEIICVRRQAASVAELAPSICHWRCHRNYNSPTHLSRCSLRQNSDLTQVTSIRIDGTGSSSVQQVRSAIPSKGYITPSIVMDRLNMLSDVSLASYRQMTGSVKSIRPVRSRSSVSLKRSSPRSVRGLQFRSPNRP